jgi:hypothetical protein
MPCPDFIRMRVVRPPASNYPDQQPQPSSQQQQKEQKRTELTDQSSQTQIHGFIPQGNLRLQWNGVQPSPLSRKNRNGFDKVRCIYLES